MNKILITGASGFIGRSLSAAFLDKGDQVYGVDVFVEGMSDLKKHPNFTAIQVANDSFETICKENVHDIDIVYHLGWAGKLGGKDLNDFNLQISNVHMTNSLINKMLEIGIKKFVLCGSISHYKFMKDTDAEINSDIYGLAKKFASELALTTLRYQKVKCNIALLANTFGVGDRSQKAVNTLIRKFQNHEELSLIDGKTLNDWVYINDTVRGLLAIGEKGVSYKTYYLGHRNLPTFEENLITLKSILKSNLALRFGTYYDITYADYSKVDLEALYKDTGFQCECDFEDSLKKTADWLKIQDKGGSK